MTEILYGTPKWVYAALVVTLYYGIAACFPSREHPRRLLIMPSFFFLLAIYFAVGMSSNTMIAAGAFAVGAAIGISIAMLAYKARQVGFNDKAQLLVLPGERTLLGVLLLVFAFKYCLGYWAAVDGGAASTVEYVTLNAGLAGTAAAFLMGRSLSFLRQSRDLRREHATLPVS